MAGKCNFSFKHYEECVEMISKSDTNIELIHDVDHTIDNLVEFAKIEQKYNLNSTFFIRVHAKNYNAFSEKSKQAIRQIKQTNSNAKIGLHFEPKFYKQENQKLAIQAEVGLLKLNYQIDISSISIHEPARFGMITEDQVLDGLTLYGYGSEYYKEKKYISDSGGRWREGCMCQHIDKHQNLIILTHPIWWYNKTSGENY